MKKTSRLTFEFVHAIPEKLDDGTLYLSMDFATAVHKCCCGCGHEVVTPLSPTDWKLTFDGASVSLSPSIGNWSFPCRSHYWIKRNSVEWADKWSSEQIAAGRAGDYQTKKAYFGKEQDRHISRPETPREGIVARVWRWLSN